MSYWKMGCYKTIVQRRNELKMVEETPVEQQIPPVKIAFIIDGEVVDILHTDERLAAIFLSQPIILDVTGEDGRAICEVGSTYDVATKTFGPKPVQE